jgi:uncharacterized protein YdeI (BOF family)
MNAGRVGIGWLLAGLMMVFAQQAVFSETASSSANTSDGDKLTAIEDVRRGQRVTLRGEVTRINDEDKFTLRDDTGRIRIYIGWQNDMPVDEGETVTVHGVADDDVIPFMCPEIYARWIERADGQRIDLRTGRSRDRYE